MQCFQNDLRIRIRRLRLGAAAWVVLVSSAALADTAALPEVGLTEALGLVAAGHPSVRARLFDRDGAQRGVDMARAQRLPNLSAQVLGGSGSRMESALRVQLPVWNAGRIGAEIGTAEAQRDAAGFAVGEVVTGLAGRVVSGFAEFGRLRMRAQAAQDNVDEHERLTALVERRSAAGVSSLADLVLGRTRLAQARLELAQVGFQIRSTLNALEQAVGQPMRPALVASPASLVLPAPETAADEAANRSPTMRRLSAELAAADAAVLVKRAALFPQVVARYDHSRAGGSGVFTLALEYQTGAGLSTAGALDQARARRASLQMSMAAAERDLREQTRADWLEASSLQGQSAMLETLVRGTAETSASMLRQFQAGRKSWLEVLNAQREDALARYALADALWGGWYAAARLGLAMGRVPSPETGDLLPLPPARP